MSGNGFLILKDGKLFIRVDRICGIQRKGTNVDIFSDDWRVIENIEFEKPEGVTDFINKINTLNDKNIECEGEIVSTEVNIYPS